ncbi:hypothetical protein KEM56_006043 [Ascosphaera pollenicola]|nr:hypothetical protein KEM56_006043 [Ascosphaera pollenicola]
MEARLPAWVSLRKPMDFDDLIDVHSNILAVDLGGSLAVASRGLYATGVSTDLNVTYLRSGGKIGEKILGFQEATCDKFGKTLAFTTIQFKNEKDDLVARGSHTKYVTQAWKDPNNTELKD